jgi:hypothetical protein
MNVVYRNGMDYCMRLLLFFFLLLVLPLSTLIAHPTSEPLKKGNFDVSWYVHPTMSGTIDQVWKLRNSDPSSVYQMDYYPLTGEYNPSAGGTLFLIEYGLTDTWSLGAQVNGFDFFFHGIKDGSWDLYPSLYTTINPIQVGSYTLNLESEFQVAPLVSTPRRDPSCSDNVFNLFNTASNNWKLVGKGNFATFVYIDAKWIFTWVNAAYLASNPYKGSFSSDGVNWTSKPYSTNSSDYHTMSRIAAAVGTEIRWGSFRMNLGLNIPILDFALKGPCSELYFLSPESTIAAIGLKNMELSWRWRL